MTTPILAGEQEQARRAKLFSTFAALSLAFLLFIVYRDDYLHFSHQSRQCAIAARSLLDRGTFELRPGKPYAIFGPLYPVLLAGLGSLGITLSHAIVILNSAAVSFSLLTFYWIARQMRLAHPGWITAFYAALAINPYLFRMARADMLFVWTTMLAVLSLSKFARTGKRTYLLIAALSCALATTGRYMGVFPLAPLCAYVFVKMRRPHHPREWAVAAGFFLLAWVPISLWLLRNKILTGYLVGMSRETWTELASSANPLVNFHDILRTAAFDLLGIRVMGVYQVVAHGNFTPHRLPTNVLLAAVAAALLIAIVYWARRKGQERVEPSVVPEQARLLFELVHVYVLLYVVAMVILWSWGNIDAISTRYVAPIYWGLVILGTGWWERLRGVRGAKPLRAVLAGTALLVFAVNVDKSVRLFGRFPGEELIQKGMQGGAYVWLRNPTWDREAVYAPVDMKNRVVDE